MVTVAISSAKGGVGKTSVVLGLASAALERQVPTLVVDLDPQADATTGLDVTAHRDHDVASVLASPKRKIAEAAVAPSGWASDHPGMLDVLTGTSDSAMLDVPEPDGEALEHLRRALRKIGEHDLALLDCPPSLGGLTRSAWAASDLLLVVSDASRFSVAAVDRTLREVAALRRGPRPVGILVNRYNPRSPEQRFRLEELREIAGYLVLDPLPDRAAIGQAQGAGLPVHRVKGVGARQLATRFEEILDRIMDAR
ncbi:ParA family protein [Kineococcus gynurae]|uniref:ParA family protein n=1 Tax=Kineococcus gynurae TaxID=452979 RepID=A0ABV5LXJ1_9ACTN